jgi:hypothetical protein
MNSEAVLELSLQQLNESDKFHSTTQVSLRSTLRDYILLQLTYCLSSLTRQRRHSLLMRYCFQAINFEHFVTWKAHLINFPIRVYLLNALNFSY